MKKKANDKIRKTNHTNKFIGQQALNALNIISLVNLGVIFVKIEYQDIVKQNFPIEKI